MRQRYHYIIVFCCFLSLFVNIGLPSTSFAVYQPSIVALVGDAAGSTILAVRILVSVLAITVVDRYYDMLDTRLHSGQDVEDMLGIPLVGHFPALERN